MSRVFELLPVKSGKTPWHKYGYYRRTRNINQQMADSKYSVYKKSAYWHQQTSETPDSNMKDMLMQVAERLAKIEAKLDSVENKLKQ